MATASKSKTLNVACPFCMGEDATITLDLGNLDGCQCSACDAEFSPAEAAAKFREMADRWAAVAEWVSKAPVV